MKIVAPGGPSARVSRTRKAGSSESGDFAKKLDNASETKAGEPNVGVSPLRSLDALLELQSEPYGRDTNEEEARRGHVLLDELEAIRTGLLAGWLPRGRLEALARVLERRQDIAVSPRLASIISDIELRVKVELAKLSAI